MGFNEHAATFAGRPVAEHDSDQYRASPKKYVPRFAVEWDTEENAVGLLNAYLERPEAATVTALVFGAWAGELYEEPPTDLLAALVADRDRLPALRHLFLGDVIYEECMTSSMVQGDYGPFLAAYPELETLRVRGSAGLSFGEPFRHAGLKTLVIEDGGLREEVIRAVCAADLPNLEHLELWLGTSEYGGVDSADSLRPLLAGGPFPKLRYLGLRNAAAADAVAAAVAPSAVLSRVRVLDLSMGALSDAGAEALVASPAVAKLEKLDLRHHYLSDGMMDRVRAAGIKADLGDQQKADVNSYGGEEHVYRYISVSE